MRSILNHELTHAQQFQYVLSTEGGLEKIINGYKNAHPDLSKKDIRKLYPFLFSYKSDKLLDSKKRFVATWDKDGCIKRISYNIDSIISAFANYDFENLSRYYSNIVEICAMDTEAYYWEGITVGVYPKPKGMSEKAVKNIAKMYRNNVNLSLELLLKSINKNP